MCESVREYSGPCLASKRVPLPADLHQRERREIKAATIADESRAAAGTGGGEGKQARSQARLAGAEEWGERVLRLTRFRTRLFLENRNQSSSGERQQQPLV